MSCSSIKYKYFMTFKKQNSIFLYLLLCLIAISGLSCGSGGGGLPGSNFDSSNGPLSYTGITSQAIITEQNAAQIAYMALEGESSSFPNSATDKSDDRNRSSIVPDSNILKDTLNRSMSNFSSKSLKSNISNAVESFDDSETGDCGGKVSRTLYVDTETGEFSGTQTYSNYCSGGQTMSGTAYLSGQLSIYSGSIITMKMSFSELIFIYEGKSFIMQGDFTYEPLYSNNMSLTMDYLVKCTCDDKTYKYNAVQIHYEERSTSITSDISGRFYEPDHGYVELETFVPFRKNYGDRWSSEGELLIKGSNGTSAKLLVLSSQEYAILVDSDGDSVFDWSRIFNWDEEPNVSNGKIDKSSPTPPTEANILSISDTEMSLSWSESSDNLWIVGYHIYKNGIFLTSTSETIITIENLEPVTQYCFAISSYDIEGNES